MPKNNRTQRDATIFVRIDSDDLARLVKLAKEKGFDSAPAYLRWRIKKDVSGA